MRLSLCSGHNYRFCVGEMMFSSYGRKIRFMNEILLFWVFHYGIGQLDLDSHDFEMNDFMIDSSLTMEKPTNDLNQVTISVSFFFVKFLFFGIS